MIRTADRKGNIKKEDSFQNNLLEKIYWFCGRAYDDLGRWLPRLFPRLWESFWIPGFRQQQWNRLSGSIIWI